MKTITNPTYVLRSGNNNLQSYGEFQWPEKGYVEAPDWNPKPVCGGGLYGLLMGKGAANLLNWYSDAIWQVIEVQEDTVVWIRNDQVKFPYGNIIYSGNRKDATDLIISLGADPKDVPGSYQIGGDNAKLIGGFNSTVHGGDYSTLTGGDYSTVQGGNFSTVEGGDGSNLTGGNWSTLQSGRFSTLTGGYTSKFKAGKRSCFIGSYSKDDRKRFVTVYVGERGIKDDTWYRFEKGVFTEVVDN